MLSTESLEHAFSIEMKSKRYVKNISISDEAHDRVLFEGNLGKLLNISLVEGDILELIGVNGALKISLTREQLQETIKAASQVKP
jgi:capsular polysaccharide biosynthesis protein